MSEKIKVFEDDDDIGEHLNLPSLSIERAVTLTLRQYYIGQAIAGLCANGKNYGELNQELLINCVASEARQLADALLEGEE